MSMLPRLLMPRLEAALKRDKSLLLLGARQTGKSTLIQSIDHDLLINFANTPVRLQYEMDSEMLIQRIGALQGLNDLPLVIIDEVQKVPNIMDTVQYLIDEKKAQFILTGSSARKLKNLLPGRVVVFHLEPLTLEEMSSVPLSIHDLLLYGALPGIVQLENSEDRELDLVSYVETYLEEEIRSEALVRNLAHFNRFLYFAAIESGNQLNYLKISQDIGVTHQTISSYYQILEDCLIAKRIEPIIQTSSRKQLVKTQKVLFFDLGLRRVAAREGVRLPETHFGRLFEQFVGLELLRRGRIVNSRLSLHYWRDANGPEVDWVLNNQGHFIPIEVKWKSSPKAKDVKHLMTFCREYGIERGYVICRCPHKLKITDNIYALPWQQIDELIVEVLS